MSLAPRLGLVVLYASGLLAGCDAAPNAAPPAPPASVSPAPGQSPDAGGGTAPPSGSADAGGAHDGGTAPDAGREADAGAKLDASSPPSDPADGAVSPPDGPPLTTSGTINFHLLLGVAGSSDAGDSLTLDGDNYTDLIMSNFVAGVMYGQLIASYTPGMQFNKEYLYGSIFGQLLQENLSTESYTATSVLLDPSPLQSAVMGTGQGGPYQINNYAADMVYGTYAPKGYSLINYVAVQKGIGYSFAAAATQYEQTTPAPFNNKYYGPMLTAYFHFNDYVALQQVGPQGGYVPQWEPDYDNALTTFKSLPNSFLDILLNAAYNQGYYGPLLSSLSKLGASATTSTLATLDSYSHVWGVNDTYEQYPYQVRYYLDQLYDNPIPTTSPTVTVTPTNHVIFKMANLGDVFANVFETLAYQDPAKGYGFITHAQTTTSFASALAALNLSTTAALDLSAAADRAKIFSLLEAAIAKLQVDLGADFTARSATAL